MYEAEIHYDAGAYPRPEATGNDIDVYLKPLIEDLLLLWKEEGVRMWDAHREEHFNLRALLFVTTNDWPALSNLSDIPIRVIGHAPIV